MSRLTINSNIASLNAQRNFGIATKKLSESYTRLSSGLRINRAVDDAAGLSISESLKADTRLFNQGVRNLNDGASVLNIADGALSELSSIMIRLNELAEQSANGTLGNKQRQALNQEAQSLSKEYNRIARSTEFNGQKIFDGNFGELTLAAGGGVESLISEGLGGAIGDGTFGTITNYTAGGSSYNLSSADVNQDGIADIISTDYGTNIFILVGNGDGTFKAATSLTDAFSASEFTIGDFNSDGKVDIAAVQTFGGAAGIHFGNGNGSFKARIAYDIGGSLDSSRAITTDDFNNDGVLDLATTQFIAGTTMVLLGNADGSFRGRVTYQTGGQAADVQSEDLNNDGFADLVVTDYFNGKLSILQGNGNGTFSLARTISGLGSMNSLALIDLNNDGEIDIAASDSSGYVRSFLNAGNLNFSTAGFASTPEAAQIKYGDFNGDGNTDIYVSDFTTGSLSIVIGNGDGSFKARNSYTTASANRGLSVNDFNQDGILDIVASNQGNGLVEVRLGIKLDGVSALQSFSLKTQNDSRESMSYLRKTLERIGQQRGHIGAFQSRVETATSNLYQSSLAYSEANSRITDADIAEESSKLAANQIIQQAAASVLGQANLQPRLVLQLLQGI